MENKIVHLGQAWPDGTSDNRYWIGVSLANVQYAGQPHVIGQECRSFSEIEQVAGRIKAELEVVLSEARRRVA